MNHAEAQELLKELEKANTIVQYNKLKLENAGYKLDWYLDATTEIWKPKAVKTTATTILTTEVAEVVK